MAKLLSFGRVTNDLELRQSARQNLYVRFGLAERIGYGERARTQFYEVWAWDQAAQRLSARGVKKGSLIWVCGALELVEYTKKDGVTKDKQLKLKLDDWGYAPPTGDRATRKQEHPQVKEEGALPEPAPPVRADVVDGEREVLPE